MVAFAVSNTIANLQRAGLASGYGFLFDTASFDINQRLIAYDSTSSYGRAFIVGGLNTILVAALGVVAATILGFVAGTLRLSRNYLVSRMVTVYIEFTRNVPLLLQIIFWWTHHPHPAAGTGQHQHRHYHLPEQPRRAAARAGAGGR